MLTKILLERRFLLFLCYFAFLLIFLFAGLNAAYLVDWDENVYSEASKQMIQRGDYLNIYVNGDLFHEKPPFFLWLQVLTYKIFGINEFAARLPSAIFGFFSVLLCIFAGRYFYSLRLGMLWGLIYITSLLPAVLTKSATLEVTLNFWIALAIVCLFICDEQNSKTSRIKKSKNYFLFLSLASISMGLAVLTKGIVGGVIPVFVFICYKILQRHPKIPLLDFFYSSVLSVLVAASWFLVNFLVSGVEYLTQSIEFQKRLLFQSAQGHSGPFYYHFIALFFGLFPWTPFLFSCVKKKFAWNLFASQNCPKVQKNFFLLCICWVVFVLIVFSFVKNKLPHYSASLYFPLALLTAFALNKQLQENIFSKRILFFFLGFCLAMGGIFLSLHLGMRWWLEKLSIPFIFHWKISVYFTGTALIFGGILVFIFFLQKKNILAIISLAIMSLCLSQGLWRLQLPIFQQFSQDMLVEQVANLQKTGKVVFYKFTAVAPIFYNNTPIPTFGSSIFSSPKLDLHQPIAEKIYIITKGKQNKEKLEQEFFSAIFLQQAGDLYIYKLH